MAALDFPVAPSTGQKYPVTPVVGVPQYTWDGEKWTTVGAQISSSTPATALPLMDATPAVVGVTTKYAREDHVHPTDTTRSALNQVVRYDAAQSLLTAEKAQARSNIASVSYETQALSASEATQTRKNLYAAPLDAMAYSGMQINGSMEVSQERGTGATTTHNAYICDGWRVQAFGTMAFSAGIASNLGLPGMPSYFYVAITTAQGSLGASDLINAMQAIEGYRVSRLGWGTASAQPVTIGFWSSNTPAGVYSGTVRNGASNRSYGFTYTQNAANIPQYNTVTIPGDTTGTWTADNTVGMYLCFTLAAGVGQTLSAANTWTAGNFQAAPGQMNGAAAVNNALRITGVVVLPGIEAPSAARSPLIMRPYDQELLTCKRYYETAYNPGSPPGTFIAGNGNQISFVTAHRALKGLSAGSANRAYAYQPFTVSMRAAPTMAYWCYGGVASAFSIFDINGAGSVNGSTADGFRGVTASVYGATASNGGGAGFYYSACMWTADARL